MPKCTFLLLVASRLRYIPITVCLLTAFAPLQALAQPAVEGQWSKRQDTKSNRLELEVTGPLLKVDDKFVLEVREFLEVNP